MLPESRSRRTYRRPEARRRYRFLKMPDFVKKNSSAQYTGFDITGRITKQTLKREEVSTKNCREMESILILGAGILLVEAGQAQPPAPRLDSTPVVALTFDDLPAGGNLMPPGMTREQVAASIVDTLNANHISGVYGFVNAKRLEWDQAGAKVLQLWISAGMNLGNHSWSHLSLGTSTATEYEADIARNESVLATYSGDRDWHWFRYTYLWEGDTLEKRRAIRDYLKEHGYRIAQVTLEFGDYDWNDPYARCAAKGDTAAIEWLERSYLENAAENITVGREEARIAFGREIPYVMLLHDTPFTSVMLTRLIGLLKDEGFRFATLAEVEADPAYAEDPDAPRPYGGTFQAQIMDSRRLPYPKLKPRPLAELQSVCQ
jgi:peptidoglycan-N-acetylglucosamine deacetylase